MYISASLDDSGAGGQDCNRGADRAAGLSGRPAAYCPQLPVAANRTQASFQYMLPLTHYNLSVDGPEVGRIRHASGLCQWQHTWAASTCCCLLQCAALRVAKPAVLHLLVVPAP